MNDATPSQVKGSSAASAEPAGIFDQTGARIQDLALEAGFNLTPTENMLYTVRGNHAQLVNFARLVRATATQGAPRGLHVECRECSNCGHIGINDSHATDASCSRCEWNGPSPKKDHCPGCHRDGTMNLACPECSHRYNTIAEGEVTQGAPTPAPFDFHWLVELRPAFAHHPHFDATYYAGWMADPMDAAKTKDPLAAARFARKEDAEQVADKLGHTLSCIWTAVEHGFAAGIQPTPAQERRRTEYTPGGMAVTVVDDRAAQPTPAQKLAALPVLGTLHSTGKPGSGEFSFEPAVQPTPALPEVPTEDMLTAVLEHRGATAGYALRFLKDWKVAVAAHRAGAGIQPTTAQGIERLAERIRVNAEGALTARNDRNHVARSLEMIAEDALAILAAAATPPSQTIHSADTQGLAAAEGDKP